MKVELMLNNSFCFQAQLFECNGFSSIYVCRIAGRDNELPNAYVRILLHYVEVCELVEVSHTLGVNVSPCASVDANGFELVGDRATDIENNVISLFNNIF